MREARAGGRRSERGAGLSPRRCREQARLLGLFALLACTSATEPGTPVTLWVTNATCTAEMCTAIEIRGFPAKHPSTPGGLWSMSLGTVSTPGACFTFPAADTARVTDAGTGKTTIIVWTIHDRMALGTWEPGAPAFTARPSTAEFAPGTAEGWRITLPGGAAPTPAGACLAAYPD